MEFFNKLVKYKLISRISHLKTVCCYSAASEPCIEKRVHPFRQAMDENQVLQYLSENIIFYDHDIAVFNKPAGIGKTPPQSQIVEHFSGQTVGPAVYIEKILPKIAALVPNLQNPSIVKFPERYSSGIMVLAGSDRTREHFQKCRRRAKSHPEFTEEYLVISMATPIKQHYVGHVAVKLDSQEGKRKVPILLDKWSNRSYKEQLVVPVHVGHTVLNSSTLGSLNRGYFSTLKANVMRLYFATKQLSPLLGDFVFASRVKTVLGSRLIIDPYSDVANSTQRLSADLLTALQLNRSESNLVPLCVHLAEIRLRKFLNGKDLILRAPPPPTFLWVCERLGLTCGPAEMISYEKVLKAKKT